MKKVLIAFALLVVSSAANAGVIVYTWEDGNNLVSEYSGTLNLNGLSFAQGSTAISHRLLRPSRNFYFNMDDYIGYFNASVSVVGGISSTALSAVGNLASTSYYGDAFGFGNTSSLNFGGAVYVADDFVNGSSISGGSTIANASMATLGLSAPATVTFSWSSDSIVHYYGVNPYATVSAPSSILLAIGGLFTLVLVRNHRQQ
ncbi:hypothetical protein [Alteromonas sp. KUL49]|uniref:hypothetical protein n=1 Tax=Alteromonas sp. KUL49 TaxID=2480798 RepID=UPI00102EF1AA|nr:hypothetical protein [Alteromonas sp. KUL49]TAP42236.1 hypothetical protein EYS00_01005 [Alteromonas sp. KUL49]GEA09826.1 hypothetical protein KUL49_02010 [Alteromonas sp. KUL49]